MPFLFVSAKVSQQAFLGVGAGVPADSLWNQAYLAASSNLTKSWATQAMCQNSLGLSFISHSMGLMNCYEDGG